MKISPFKLEKYFAKHEFSAKYMLSSSDCDGFPMEYVLSQADEQEMELWNNLTLGYTEGAGSLFLREAIAKFYPGSTPENIVVASPGELSFILMNNIMHGVENPHAVVVAPAYQSLYDVLNALDCELSFWKPDENWKYNVEDLKKLIKPSTRLIVINFPHNPTGAYITPEQLHAIVEIAREQGAYIYSDEMYRDIIIDPACEALPPVATIYEKGISLWGAAKSFGLAGLRTGWFVSQDKELLGDILTFKDYLSICNSAPSEVLTAIALNHSEKFIGPNVAKIKSNMEYFKEVVESGKLPFVESFTIPQSGSIAFVKINPAKADYLVGYPLTSAMEFSDAIVEKYGVMTVPAPMFDYPGDYLRIGFGRENFKEVVDMLQKK